MGFLNILSTGLSLLFGSSSNGKGAVGEISDAVDRWHPSAQTIQENSIEDLKAGDASQESARAMSLPYHDSWFDIFVDGLNRMVRPVVTYWIVGGLMGLWHLNPPVDIPDIMWNIIWTVITFWFGSRVIFKDIPNAVMAYRVAKTKVKKKPKKKEETPDYFDDENEYD